MARDYLDGEITMTERETLAREIAGDHYGLSLEGDRSYLNGRLTDDERGAFDAGWEAAKQFYANQNVQNQ